MVWHYFFSLSPDRCRKWCEDNRFSCRRLFSTIQESEKGDFWLNGRGSWMWWMLLDAREGRERKIESKRESQKKTVKARRKVFMFGRWVSFPSRGSIMDIFNAEQHARLDFVFICSSPFSGTWWRNRQSWRKSLILFLRFFRSSCIRRSGQKRRAAERKSFLLLLREIQFDCNMFRFRCEGRRRKARDGRVFHQQKSSCTWFRISLWRELIGEFVTWKNSNRIVPERDSLWLQFVSNQRGELLRAKLQSFHSMFAL